MKKIMIGLIVLMMLWGCQKSQEVNNAVNYPVKIYHSVSFFVYNEEGESSGLLLNQVTGIQYSNFVVQTVEDGGNTQSMLAIPNNGYFFYKWTITRYISTGSHSSETSENPLTLLMVKDTIEVEACFLKIHQ